MLVIYHLHSGCAHWSPSSKVIDTSKRFTRELMREKTGFRIDEATSDGGTTSTGNVARECFQNKHEFIFWITSLIPSHSHDVIRKVHTNISAIYVSLVVTAK